MNYRFKNLQSCHIQRLLAGQLKQHVDQHRRQDVVQHDLDKVTDANLGYTTSRCPQSGIQRDLTVESFAHFDNLRHGRVAQIRDAAVVHRQLGRFRRERSTGNV